MPNSRAVITMVHNEALFFPIWLEYYSRFFGADDIYVFDHDTSDGSTSGSGFVRIPVTHDCVDHVWMVDTIQALQHELVAQYDSVLVTDVDEIVAPKPTLCTLGQYLDIFDEEFVTCRGFEILHMRTTEPPYDPSIPIMSQRGYWFENALYSKPCLATTPVEWLPGFHFRTDHRTNDDLNLFLIHLHRMDFERCRARHRLRRARAWGDRDLALEWATHNRLVADAEFEQWFDEETGWNEVPMEIKPIPRIWKGVF